MSKKCQLRDTSLVILAVGVVLRSAKLREEGKVKIKEGRAPHSLCISSFLHIKENLNGHFSS